MRILRCHIENFGKLKDLAIDFTDNLHIIHENNGWGKSTLAAFIKVMFYGFTNEGKRSEAENERKKYKPWQGGVYGGEITFEVNQKTYRFTRTFGTKEKEDTFTLYDTKTNLSSEDYSSDIGEELFKIDRESFSRTIFIAQSDIVTNATDSINAKIGNLVENTDDINNYDAVQERFKKLLSNMSPTRSTGSINKKKNEITRLESNISRGKGIDQALEELTEKLHRRKETKDKLKEEQSAVQRQMEQVSGYKDLQSKKEAYERICSEHVRAVNAVTEEQRFFPAAVPTESELGHALEEADKLAGYQGELLSLRLTGAELQNKIKLEQQFRQGIPETEALDFFKNKIKRYSDLCLEIARTKPGAEDEAILAGLNHKFGAQLPEDFALNQYISLWNQRAEMKSGLGASKATLYTLKSMYELSLTKEDPKEAAEPGKRSMMIPMILGLLALIPGLLGITGILFPFQFGIVCISIGIVLIILSMLLKPKQTRVDTNTESQASQGAESFRELEQQIAKEEEKIQDVEANIQVFFRQYAMPYAENHVISDLYELKEQIQDYKELVNRKQKYLSRGLENVSRELEHEIRAFLQDYDPDGEITADSFSVRIQKLEEQRAEYSRLEVQENKYQKARLNYDSSYRAVTDFIRTLEFDPAENLTAQLREIRDHIRSLAAAENRAGEKQKEKADFESKNDIRRYKVLEVMDDLMSMEALNQRFSEINSQLERMDDEIASYNRQADNLTEERGLLDEEEEQLKVLKEELEENLRRYNIILKTKDFLEKAKESFTARYIGPVMAGFEKYYNILTGEEAINYKIDANMNITAKEHGGQRNPKLLSTGYQDLVGLCMRMAFVDAMFQGEKPFIIVDDSFVNLDDNKVKGGLKFLFEIAGEYQVIYFTCHESRL